MTNTNHTILVVDDDEDFLLQQQAQLQALGFHVVTASTRKKAEEAFAASRPDLAIVDVMMEDIDAGLTLCHLMKKAKPDMPVILVTSAMRDTGFEMDVTTSEERSWIKADAVLDKPVRFEQLQREIERFLKD
jgi:CheY-like chemotaxis protein